MIQDRMISYMGTDGMRGTVDLTIHEDCLLALSRDKLLTKEIIELSCFAFARLLTNEGMLSPGDSVCTGSDGRDAATGGILEGAMKSGFMKCGVSVIHLGLIPTPAVPLFMLKNGLRGGAMLTASHNPSNQNGIKFFVDGKKLLPEGSIGDLALSEEMRKAVRKIPELEESGVCVNTSFADGCVDFLVQNLPLPSLEKLRGIALFLDTANGAYTDIAKAFLDRMHISNTCVNDVPTGFNINRHCGVAEIEGRERLERGDADGPNRIISALFDLGKKTGKQNFGIVLDGDGDRGFILYFDPLTDSVRVLDGDVCGFLIAAYIKSRDSDKGMAVLTIESDIMAGAALQNILGIPSTTVDVGDKWIGSYSTGPLLLGLESSGHIILPVKVESPEGIKELRAGNGLFSALMTLCAIVEYENTQAETDRPFYEPYPPGFSKTFYTYFVDKNLFSPESPAWKKDSIIIEEGLDEWVRSQNGAQKRSYRFSFVREIKKDKNLLYYCMRQGDVSCASIFIRNSGTENKNAVYLKCRRDLAEGLLPLAREIRDFHRRALRDTTCQETLTAEKILKLLWRAGKASLADIEKELKGADAMTALYALTKEEQIYSAKGKNDEDLWTLRD